MQCFDKQLFCRQIDCQFVSICGHTMASVRLLLSPKTAQIATQLIVRNVRNCCQQRWRHEWPLIRHKNLSNKNNFKLNINPKVKTFGPNGQQKCFIHLSPKRYNPLVAIVLRQVAKVAAVITGRVVRKWWRDLPPNKRQLVYQWFIRHKWKFGLSLTALIAMFGVYYLSHISETPITRRKRFVAFTAKQVEELNNYEFEVQLHTFKDKLLPSSHESSKRVARVATQLLNGNNDIQEIHDHEWSVSVVNDPQNKNAFVMPSGQIFVFTGMLNICDNDQQLGTVLAHEMAHAVLGHGAELLSHAHLIDLVFICLIATIWTLLPSDITASITTGISRLIMNLISDAPYSRMLETEADIVGLELAAKACFDVRETSVFWHKMALMENAEDFHIVTTDEIQLPTKIEFLSTHPSHETRYQYLDSLMDDAIKLRTKCNCPQLPKYDPRTNIELMKKHIKDYYELKRREGVTILPKPPIPPNLLRRDS
ncbi:metalloendopeptidase OMA1, mitochondrial-like [Oppia nitens]|uniref:metalloendopeptidase OMA1, mitochondrial-like n=1 Tax=Oppia nitens TaxID=1686743 RepID=UPI0023DC05CC|nr:metalloendopeptidase OMA1, mitochondrial-like [Oppia nitens]